MRLVAVSRLKPGMVVAKSIFGNTGQRLLRQGVAITERYIEQLRRYGIEVVYISSDQDIELRDVISEETRQMAVRETKRVLENVQRGATLEMGKVHDVLVKIIDELFEQEDIMVNLVDIRSHDEELFSHSVNVAILSVITGMELELGQKDLETLATVGLLHDIGRLFCEDEQHLAKGKEILECNGNVEPKVVRAVYQHHEHWDGTGFPEGLAGKEISRYARIVAVADKFDWMSANNRYPIEEVIAYIMAMSGVEFEPQAVRAFLNCVSFYPVGTRVELNTGSSGIVVEANRGFPTRPIVRVDRNIFGALEPPVELNLLGHPTYFIVKRQEDIEDLGEAHDQ
ncbi:MAG: HD domain-containing protein [Bacillota bacterium]|nr:HD domain-containing protein [Bacillota bacterium]NLJ03846.1 HD domain-containing protein [Bacillota bacterium]